MINKDYGSNVIYKPLTYIEIDLGPLFLIGATRLLTIVIFCFFFTFR